MTTFEFRTFIEQHRELHPGSKLPAFDLSEPMYTGWLKVLHARGVAEVAALYAASERLLTEPPRSFLLHFPALCAHAEDAMKVLGSRPRHNLSTREGAEAASKGCDRGCSGPGLTVAWHPRPDPMNRLPETVAAYCVCALGRWTERNHAAKQPEIRKRMVDLKDVIEGRRVWLADPPGVLRESEGF